MLKYALMLVLGFILWKMIAKDWSFGKKKTEEKPHEPLVSRGEMVKDPVCGVFVSPGTGFSLRHEGREVHFCGQECRDEYARRLAEGGDPARGHE